MNDRLGDLRSAVPDWAIGLDDNDNSPTPIPPPVTTSAVVVSVPSNAVVDFSNGGDIEMGNQNQNQSSTNAQPDFMKTFFLDIDDIKSSIASIRTASTQINEINEDSIRATTSEKERELSLILTPLVMETNKKAKLAKILLSGVKEETDRMKKDPATKPSELRIRENLVNTLTRKFVDEMKVYQSCQQKYKSDIKNKVKRQVQIVKPDATNDEIDAVMRMEGGRDQLYKDKILKGVADPIKTAYANVADKYQDVLTLEASVAELHQMFLDFALLTEQQGELLDQIEYQVKSAGDYIDDGNVDIQSAIMYQRSIRKKQCCVIVVVLIALILVLLFSGVFSG